MIEPEKIKEWIEKIKKIGILKVMLVVVCGMVLIVFSFPTATGKKQQDETTEKEEKINLDGEDNYKRKLEEKLVDLLEQVDGVGKVKVMITLKSSKETIVNKDQPYSEETVEEASNGEKKESKNVNQEENTVLVENEAGKSEPYVVKELVPEVEGVVILCQGANQQEVVNQISEATRVLFSISVHKVKVMKMLEPE